MRTRRSSLRFTTHFLLALLCSLVGILAVAGSAAADPSTSFLRLNGYGGVAERVLTAEDVILDGGVGSFGSPYGPPQPALFITSLDLDTFERWNIMLVPPLGAPLVAGTYSNAGGIAAFPSRPVIHVLHHGGLPFNHTCDGGSFTIHSINGHFFDVEWTQQCLGLSVSARAVFVPPPDLAPPFIEVPSGGQLFAAALGPDGVVVPYQLAARDAVDGPVPVSCVPASGSMLPIGTTKVTCTASDAAGNQAHASFDVHIIGAEGQLDAWINVVAGLGPGTSLADKLRAARVALDAGDRAEACELLGGFLNEVRAQSGKKLTHSQADELTAAASRIRAVLVC